MTDGSTLDAARATHGVRTARLSDGATAYHVHGERGPWVVLVHGLITPMYAWAPLATALAAAGFRVLRYDHFGRGLSDRPAGPNMPALYVRQLRELAAALGIDAAHVVAWSMGCVVASGVALEHPALVRSLVLMAPGLFLAKPLRLRVVLRLPFGARLIAARIKPFIDALPAEHLAHPERFPAYIDGMREQLRYPGVGASLASTLAHYPWHAGPEFRGAGEHPRPVLLLWGDADPATPYANAPRVQALYPRAELVTLPGARHAPHVEHAEQVHAVIVEFLTRASDPAA